MEDFFNVTDLETVLELTSGFPVMPEENIPLLDAAGRILSKDMISKENLPDFSRSVMDGYAVQASSTFGASDGNPAFLNIIGAIAMGETPALTIGPGEAARIPTGGMLPKGADSVVMVEHAEEIDDTALEVYKSVAPGQNMIEIGEDFKKNTPLLFKNSRIRAQESGLLAAFGVHQVPVFKKPVIGIISTGDEIIPIDRHPGPAEIRDINTYTLNSLVSESGGVPLPLGIVRDHYNDLLKKCILALEKTDMVLISGGSSVGNRDFTIKAISALPESDIMVHGIAISPGKPTILARAGTKAVWGLPGHVVSSMVVYHAVVKPFIEHISGLSGKVRHHFHVPAKISRNISSAQGRVDFIRVRLFQDNDQLWADPILGKSALINTMVKADGLIKIPLNSEGIEKGTWISVIPV